MAQRAMARTPPKWHTSRRIRTRADDSSVVEQRTLSKGLKLLSGPYRDPLVAGSSPAGGAIIQPTAFHLSSLKSSKPHSGGDFRKTNALGLS
jgi:hypothetical protein